jgi:hypothetical protein
MMWLDRDEGKDMDRLSVSPLHQEPARPQDGMHPTENLRLECSLSLMISIMKMREWLLDMKGGTPSAFTL